MALWKENSPAASPPASGAPAASAPAPSVTELHKASERGAPDATMETRRAPARVTPVESMIAAELSIEGKIVGSGDVRIN